jgi:uncharacterized membrane protein YjgN (DUF898 family)
MDTFEYDKIAGAVLSALLVIFGGRALRDIVLQVSPITVSEGTVLAL